MEERPGTGLLKEEKTSSRKTIGKVLGVVGMVLLFGAAIVVAIVPTQALSPVLMGPLVAGLVLLLSAYLLVR